ncbi:conserved hypothetical protein [Trichinella spiralis]|uniref:hypothetical protein n=1 Tax=Trichinella spiralis TaxID=6334 RepID=UPI0001EFE7BC|nr:conserved hypothetical protein [Trichinella spiralis]
MARRSLMVRWGSGSKPSRNKLLIYRRAAGRGTVSKTMEESFQLTHPSDPLRRNTSIYWSGEDHPAFSELANVKSESCDDTNLENGNKKTRPRERGGAGQE